MTILDTNVVSEIMRPAPETMVLRWFANLGAEETYVTAITVAEILLGIELLPVGKRRDVVRGGAARTLAVFAGRILAFDDNAARPFSLISSTRRQRGKPMSALDAQIAAICSEARAVGLRTLVHAISAQSVRAATLGG